MLYEKFCLIDSVFCLTEALQFYEVPFVSSRSYSTSHCCSIQEFFLCAHILEAFPTFSSISFSVSGFIWSSLIDLDLILVQGDRTGSILIFLHGNRQLCHHHLLKMLSFFPLDGFSSLVEDQVTIGVWFISGSSILFHWSTSLLLYQYHAVFITIAL